MAVIVWMLIYGSFTGYVMADICVYSQCQCYANFTYCNGLELKEIPQLTGSGVVTDLSFDMNHISNVPPKRLPPNLIQLSIVENPLSSIDDSAFDDSVNTLNSIILSGANFPQFPKAFGQLRKLTYLQISNSRVLDWNEDAMENIGTTVNSMTLQDCGLLLWPDWLNNFKNLSELSFFNNSLSSIPDNALDSLANTLTVLDLQNNSFTSTPKALTKLLVLQTLYLEFNRISEVNWLPSSPKLFTLSLNNNDIYDTDQLSKAVLPLASSLNGLFTGYNNMRQIPKLGFLKQVTYLDFSFNQISDSISGELPVNLTSISLNSNYFRSIPKVFMTLKYVDSVNLINNMVTQIRDFEFPPWATGAEFGYNFITELTDNSFPPNSSLGYINLSHNPLNKISSRAFQNTPLMTYINVESTRLTRLPLGLLSGKALNSFDCTDCVYLVCTCEEKALAPWITSLSYYSVVGSCGRTTILDFFNTLVKDCP